MLSQQDHELLSLALDLAREGVALTSPNPSVGAIVADSSGQVVGEGFHTYEGRKHAEVLALEHARERAKGGTLYLTLEPCSHVGRTGPCTEAVIASGVKRVVVAMTDPNPNVAGRGIDRVRAAGIRVDIAEGELHNQARKINEGFAKYIQHHTPLVTLKAGMTLDGKIAPPPGEQDNPTALGAGGATGGYITSEEARAHVQTLRHQSDAILVGVGTIIADDPLLTDRTGLSRRRPLLRVIIDSRLRLSVDSRVVKTAKNDVIVFCAFAEEKRRRELEAHGVTVEQILPGAYAHIVGGAPIRSGEGRPNMRAVVQRLGELEITSLLIEGGALVNWAALASGIVDKIFLYYAPKILAGTGAVPFASGEGFRHLTEAAHVKNVSLHRFGEDFAVEGYLKDPYEPAPQPKKQAGPALVYEGV
jgi:diaminohydroxyphosphoribosylaminopyrimidine deaminase/5-amino-6-(5-phosphoribosylamino)uracil reductase